MFTASGMTLASLSRERDHLIGIRIPAEFLPATRKFGQVGFPDTGPETGGRVARRYRRTCRLVMVFAYALEFRP
jgi:hypothetical protein